jgi:glycosyltransferase involved in cell wall biosynthesis
MKLSIITINYNNSADLVKTIDSVLAQTWMDYEFIIIDGGSTDGSVDHIKAVTDKLSYWVSEKDEGVFHAMNKGIGVAKGEYLLMLNAGDYLVDSTILERCFGGGQYQADILFGDVYREADGKVFEKSIFPDQLTFGFLRRGALSHQASFIKREIHDLVGLYDESLKYCSDWKFLILALCRYNVSYQHLQFFVSVCDCGGLTCNPANFRAMGIETESVLRQYFPTFLSDYYASDLLEGKKLKFRVKLLQQNLKSHIKNLLPKAWYAT